MICISIAQESKRLVLADMLNASRQCDLLEVQMDRFSMAPDVAELLENRPKPLILSCRRPQDGGNWQGNENDRQTLLRQSIAGKANYVEIELDVADQIRRFPPALRVISYTNLKETPANIAEIYAEALAKKPDVIKLVTVARTPEEAWPLVQLMSKPPVPTVVVGLGRPGVMLTMLGKKVGAPWAYAALERGMEAYPEQPTVHDLKEVYRYEDISKSTPLIGVTGFSEREYALIGVLNAGLAQLGLPARCMPLGVGNMKVFRKVMDAVKLRGLVVNDKWSKEMMEVATDLEPAARKAGSADLLLNEEKSWSGYNVFWRAAGTALEAALRGKSTPHPQPLSPKERGELDKPLQDRVVMIVGTTPTARSLAMAVVARGGIPIIAGRDRGAAQLLAQESGCRYVNFEALYSTRHDVLAVCSEEKLTAGTGRSGEEGGIHFGHLNPNIIVMDLTCMPRKSPLLIEAMRRSCTIVPPKKILLEEAILMLRLMTNKEIDRQRLENVLDEIVQEEI